MLLRAKFLFPGQMVKIILIALKDIHRLKEHLHNSIMDTLSRLAIQSKDLSPIQRDILREMHDRNNAGEIIRAYVVAQEGKEDDEDIDEKQRRRGKMSDIAHFHSLGKEH